MAHKPGYRLRATLKTGRYHVVEGRSLENLKTKGKQLANEGANGYIERISNNTVAHYFGTTSTLYADGSVTSNSRSEVQS